MIHNMDAEKYLNFLQKQIKVVTSAMAVHHELIAINGNHHVLRVKNIGGDSIRFKLEKKMKQRMEESDW